jgi:methyl-accepting chemotaxis protein
MNDKFKSDLNNSINSISMETSEKVGNNIKDLDKLSNKTSEMAACVSGSSSAIEEMVANIASISSTLQNNGETIKELIELGENGKKSLEDVTKVIEDVSRHSDSLLDASKIVAEISARTNLLGMNAAIEAAHAGDVGKGFAVVASEIRSLAESSGAEAQKIKKSLTDIKKLIDHTLEYSENSKSNFINIFTMINKVDNQESMIKDAITEQSAGGKQVLEALIEMNNITTKVKEDTDNLVRSSHKVLEDIKKLGDIK